MLDLEINQLLDDSSLPIGDKLAARCAIAGLALLRCVARDYDVPVDQVLPEDIANWCIWDWENRESAAAAV
jgi:hypothetical protein